MIKYTKLQKSRKNSKKISKTICNHEWKYSDGFAELARYICELCDEHDDRFE